MQRLCFVVFHYDGHSELQREFLTAITHAAAAGHSIDVYALEWRGSKPANVTLHVVKKPKAPFARQYAHLARSVHLARVEQPYDCIIGINAIPGLDIYYAKEPCVAEVVQGSRRYRPRHSQRLQFEKSIFSVNSPCQIISPSLMILRAIKSHYRTPASRLHWLCQETCEQTSTNVHIHPLAPGQTLGESLSEYILAYLQQPKLLQPFGVNAVMAEYGCENKLFDRIMQLTGQVVRHKEGRKTLRFEYGGEGFYAKLHKGIGIREWFKNWLSLRSPIVSARTEWKAIAKLKSLKLPTLDAVAFAEHGHIPFKRKSFLMTRELLDVQSLEQYCQEWRAHPPTTLEKRKLIRYVANYVKTMHDAHWFHRDLYVCHFLKALNEEDKCYLIDLHRMQHKMFTHRWRIKDLSALYYSALEYGLTERDILYFIKCYSGKKYSTQERLWKKIEKKAFALRVKELKEGVE